MSKQVLYVAQMQHLQKIGVDTSKASIYWVRMTDEVKGELLSDWHVSLCKPKNIPDVKIEIIPAFTVQDLIDILPRKITYEGDRFSLEIAYPNDFVWGVSYLHYGCICECFYNDVLIEALYAALCWLVENNLYNK